MEQQNNNQGLRFDSGKTRMDLLEPYAIEQVARIFSKGAVKYAPHNWLKGMAWSKMIGSLKRHISEFEQGHDYDYDPNCIDCQNGTCTNHTGELHIAQAAWNALGLISYYKYHPELDDRQQWYKKPFKKLWLDIDGVIGDFQKHFLEYLNLPTHSPSDWNDPRFKENFGKIKDDHEFWKTMPYLLKPEDIKYPITGYCTARGDVPKELIQEWLDKGGFPRAEIICVPDNCIKSNYLKDNCDIMIDDGIKNFIDLQSNGIFCVLMTAPNNIKYDVGHLRVKDWQDFQKRFL